MVKDDRRNIICGGYYSIILMLLNQNLIINSMKIIKDQFSFQNGSKRMS